MKTLSGSLAALAIVAARDGQWLDVARLLAQAAVAPDADQFLECELSDNFEANCLVNSVSGTSSMADSVAALSAALALNAEEEKAESLYDDEVVSLNTSEDEEESNSSDDDAEEDTDEDDADDVTVESDSSSLIRLRLD